MMTEDSIEPQLGVNFVFKIDAYSPPIKGEFKSERHSLDENYKFVKSSKRGIIYPDLHSGSVYIKF
jgi:hypothetical protein